MAEITHEIRIRAPRDAVYEALTTKPGMQGWHAASVVGDGSVGSTWHLEFPGAPSFDWEVTDSEPHSLVAWRCTAGPGDSVGTTVTFQLSDTGDGRTLVEHSHSGWPHDGGSFTKCNTLWGVLMNHLKRYAETSSAEPAFG